jgi:type IV secretion system protein VirB1
VLAALLRLGHSVDVGLMQVNSVHFPAFGLAPDNVFNPCVNISVGGKILGAAWEKAKRAGLTGQTALWHALQVYNSGRLAGAPTYASKVWTAANGSPSQIVMKTGGSANRAPEVLVAAKPDFSFAQSWTATNAWGPK